MSFREIGFTQVLAKTSKGIFPVTINPLGMPCNMLLLDSHLAKQYAGYVMMQKDVQLLIESLKHILNKSCSQIEKQAFLFFSVSQYAKCFTSSRGRSVRLDDKHIYKNADFEIHDTHKEIMNVRHDYISHAGIQYDSCLVTATLIPFVQPDNMDQPMLFTEVGANLQYVSAGADILPKFLIVAEYLLTSVNKIIEEKKVLLSKELANVNGDDLMSKSFIPEIASVIAHGNQ